MANESNLKSGRKWKDIVPGRGGLTVSYFVSRYLARIIPVCSGKSEGEEQDGSERTLAELGLIVKVMIASISRNSIT